MKYIIFIFLTAENQTFRHLRKFAKTNVNKQRLFLALSKDFFAVSAGDSEVTAASLDRQYHDSADFSDLSAASLDSTRVFFSFYS